MKDEFERYKRLLEEWDQANSSGPKKEAATASEAPRAGGRTDVRRPDPGRPEPPKSEPTPTMISATAADQPSSQGRAKMAFSSQSVGGRFPGGAILCLNDEELVIYRRPVSGQEDHDLVYSLLADGTAKIEILELSRFHVADLGTLPEAELQLLQERMEWNRAILAPGLRRAEDADRIPDPDPSLRKDGPSSIPRTPSSPDLDAPSSREGSPEKFPGNRSSGEYSAPPGNSSGEYSAPIQNLTRGAEARSVTSPIQPGTLRRGQRIRVKFGGKAWEAIYWGKDHKGYVVAHNTHKAWTLMHFDLDQYKDSMIVDPEPDPKVLEEIHFQLKTRTGAS